MKPIILFDAEPFCFGPISTTINLVDYLRNKTSLDRDHSFVLLGTGTSKQLAEASRSFDQVIECNTTSMSSLEEHSFLIQKAKLFVTTTNPHSINFLNQFETPRVYIDTLFWLWEGLRADFSQVQKYYIQRFFNIDQQLQKFSPYIRNFKVVNPLISFDLEKKPEEDFILINLGGMDTVYHQVSPFYEALVKGISESENLKKTKIIIAGGGDTIEVLKKRYSRSNLTINCFGKKEFKNLLLTCKKFITSPGLTSIHESHFLGKDVFFLIPQNYSQYLHLDYLRKYIQYVQSAHYEDFFSVEPMAEYLPEEEGITIVKQLSKKMVEQTGNIDKLVGNISNFLQQPKLSFCLNEELSFFQSGVEEIGKDIALMCTEAYV